MRLYYAFITGISGWVGVAFYQFLKEDDITTSRSVVVLAILFLSWGTNQIVNDYLGLEEDRVNAPNRPMVTGALNIKAALLLSSILLTFALIVSYNLNPWATIPLILGVLLNIIYEYAKAFSLLGNLIFGIMLAMCPIFGFLASGQIEGSLFTLNRFAVLIMIVLINAIMTYYTYFKDYTGDKAASKKTFVVKYGLKVSKYIGIAWAFLPAAIFYLFIKLNWMPWEYIIYKQEFVFCAVITFFLQLWTSVLYFKYPYGEKTYFSLVSNFRACCAAQCTLIAIFNGTLALYLLIISYIFIGFFFEFYKDAKS